MVCVSLSSLIWWTGFIFDRKEARKERCNSYYVLNDGNNNDDDDDDHNVDDDDDDDDDIMISKIADINKGPAKNK